jgi:6-phosphogluconolactonase (cycloisomerase 2 family)
MGNVYPAGGWRGIAIVLAVCLIAGMARAANSAHYIVTNDDNTGNYIQNSVTFYRVEADGSLTLEKKVSIGVTGIAGGYFPANRVAVLDAENNECVFASDAATGIVAGIDDTLKLRTSVKASPGDTGLSNGVGLAVNGQYLYASFTDDSKIGTFQIGPDCGLNFLGDTTVGGLQGGVIDAMAVHGAMLIATYGDGSIESFNLSSGMPVSNGDKQNSTAYTASQGATYPSAIDITQDGHYVIFGDTSTAVSVEVSDLSSGQLAATKVYQTPMGINSSNLMLSPDETLLYAVNTQGDRLTAAFFDKNTGMVSSGCSSDLIKGYSKNWSYLAGLALATNTGNGGEVYVAEFGAPSSIAMIQVTSAGGQCTLQEAPNSPAADPNSPGLLSIASFPPRSF